MVYDELIVLVHGIDSPFPAGRYSPLHNVKVALLEQAALSRAYVLESVSNIGKTRQGIEVLGERLVLEIEQTLAAVPFVKTRKIKFSVFAHSLGGLIARFACFLLLKKNVFATRLAPVGYMAVGSPHLGVVRASTVLGWLTHHGGELLYGGSRTLRQLMLEDKDGGGGVPLLVRMATGDHLAALEAFEHRTLVSAIQWDHQVTHSSSSITGVNQYATSWALLRYVLSFVSSSYHHRLVGYSGFSAPYDALLQYHSSSPKRHDASLTLEDKQGRQMLFRTSARHAARYTAHPHLAEQGDAEIEFSHPYVTACARGLQTLEWRRIDFELLSMFAHDQLVNKQSINCCGVHNPTNYSWKVLIKLSKVVAMDSMLHDHPDIAESLDSE